MKRQIDYGKLRSNTGNGKEVLMKARLLLAIAFVGCASAADIGIARWQPIEYPRLALHAQISGDVTVEVQVNSTGLVSSVKALSGHPLLGSTVEKTVRSWEYSGACEDGRPRVIKFTVAFILLGAGNDVIRQGFILESVHRASVSSKALSWQPNLAR